MITWKLTPQNPYVAKYIDCYWFLEKELGDISNNHPKLNPDPAAHLIIADHGVPYSYQQGSQVYKGHGSHLLHPYRNTWEMDHRKPFQVLGIKFNIGALYALGWVTQINQVEGVKLADLYGFSQLAAAELLPQAAKNSPAACELLDQSLAPLLMLLQEDKHSKLVKQILYLLGEVPISELGMALDRSQRTLERSFLRVTGITLKQCHSMIRLESLLNYLYKTEKVNIDWADLALEFDFSDQPHLIRYLKSTLGTTPGAYAQQRDLAIDAYGNFEFS